MAMLEHSAGAKFNHVRYRGTAQSVTDIIANRVGATFDTMVGCLPFINDGQVRALAVSTTKRSSLLPDVPTTAEAGFPEARGGAWLAMFGPAGMPKPIVAKLSEALDAAMKDEKTVAILRTLGTEPDPTGPDAMGEILRRDYDRWGEIVRITGAKPE